MGTVAIRRVYEPSPEGTFRILVDRIWPRGLSKEKAAVDLWLKEAGPSTELRKWFGHEPERFDEFAEKYRAELKDSEAYAELTAAVRDHDPVELVYSAHDTEHNQAVVLASLLEGKR
ncbi:hypothetical protein GCM10012320_08650 [Sinomonas cellulolyticus]|jgi:uncharacterized protein YeaO (DUF488 family)|uniref:DUF488 family protein n=1 Tax=Sinomonas cellulolyticus TaxID=2801916 RepID=A0ABS1K3W6_9MICC|nr:MULTISPECIES: DUF488 family protein [Sinomonas]MBL0706325.1 DUF488 family protein [Sinomonas cellulolyticus]GHG44070.1 hypothetical protein GCM10012320_08650 [Sinomonas sp. KCTC 49339]